MAAPDLHFDDTIGCFFAGTIFATLLYGCTCGQGLYYLSEYPDDRRMIKALVLTLWGLDTATTVTDSMLMWDYVVRGHQTTAALATMPSLVQSLQVILYASSSTKVFYWALFYFPGCKVDVNSTFAMLNARHHIRQGGVTCFSTGFELHAYPVDVAPERGSLEGSILPEFSEHSVTPSEARIDCKVTTEIVRQID
ncbi:hypothetical protein FOMPIDRAFT_84831 [Fomitopsis schrenkii]|uniref:Uncharacterized protein n=1 Tax=Fomitopsis schrenkii TaxID=2126942 RepID=S8FBT9_FOMSC|nr:hypothetical protein FOMPIDRAFT_84831 [Fomitopsis schrenkii]